MRIVFIGTVLFSREMLAALLEMKVAVVGVVTRQASQFNTDFADLTDLCQQHQVDYIFSNDVNSSDTLAWIRAKSPGVLFCFGWSSLLKEELLGLAPLGVVGYHPSLLPHNRGRHPLIWALALGLSKTGSTFFFMDKGADTGDILHQQEVLISADDDALSLYTRMVATAREQLQAFVPLLANGSFCRHPQDPQTGNYWRKRGKADGLIDFRMSANAIYNLVRALARPYPGAHVLYQQQDIKIWKVVALAYDATNLEPGKVLDQDGSTITVKAGEGAVVLLDHEFTSLPPLHSYL